MRSPYTAGAGRPMSSRTCGILNARYTAIRAIRATVAICFGLIFSYSPKKHCVFILPGGHTQIFKLTVFIFSILEKSMGDFLKWHVGTGMECVNKTGP